MFVKIYILQNTFQNAINPHMHKLAKILISLSWNVMTYTGENEEGVKRDLILI